MSASCMRWSAFVAQCFHVKPFWARDSSQKDVLQTSNNESGLSPRALEAVEWFRETYKEQLTRISRPGNGDAPRAIDMMTAENWLCRDALVPMYQDTVQQALKSCHLSYAPGFGGDPGLLSAAATFYNVFFQPAMPVRAEHVVAGAGCSSLLASLMHDLCGEGEGMLVEVPYWSGFEMECIMRAQVQMIPVDTTAYHHSLAASRTPEQLIAHYERALHKSSCAIKVLLVCNPHNPRGQVYTAAELTAIVRFCHIHRLHLISDEIYGLSTFGPTVPPSPPSTGCAPATFHFTPVMSLALPDPSRVHTLHGLSKDFGSSGLRLGFVVTQANALLRMSLAISNHAKVSTVSTLLATDLLSDTERLGDLLGKSNAALREAARVISDFLAVRHVPFYQPAAGVFLWAYLGHRSVKGPEDEVKLSRAFRSAGVELVAGRSCREPRPGWFRITFALPRPELLLGLQRISAVKDAFDDQYALGCKV